MSVIGFDIGNDRCVIATAKHGGIHVLMNHESKREIPAVVSFGQNQRFLGSAGAAFVTANPKSTVSQIKRLIGKLYTEVQDDLKLLPFATSEGPHGGVLIELEYLEKKWTFTPVEILAMLFKHLKRTAEKSLGWPVVVADCVIGVPAYFTDLQRRQYLNAASIAGLRPFKLIHEGTAIALGYGMYMTDFSDSGQAVVMFVDMGHCDTQVTVAAFEQGKMNILSHTFDPNLGGRDFDEVLFKHFAAEFIKTYKIDVYSNAPATVRLMESCEQLKKALGANTEAVIKIECLIGDTDVIGVITREEFENLSSELLERVTATCSMALIDCGLGVDEIHTVELVGSGSRIPAVTRNLTSFFHKELTRTPNSSFCVARGCALACAMLSPTLCVREYEVNDTFPYSIVIPVPSREIIAFPRGCSIPDEKLMKYTGSIPLSFELQYRNKGNFPAGTAPIAGHFTIGESELSDGEWVKVDFRMLLNENGVIEIDYARISQPNAHLSTMMASSDMLNLPFSENLYVPETEDELNEAQNKEMILAEQDSKVEQTQDQKNSLKPSVYETSIKLSNAYKETQDSLDEDGDDESKPGYIGKPEDLKKVSGKFEPFNQATYREKLAISIIKHNYPFSYVEHEETRGLHKFLHHDVNTITRNMVKADVLKIYEREKKILKDKLQGVSGRICLTSNLWSSTTADRFLALTCHYVDDNWVLRKKVLNFRVIPPPYNGHILAEDVIEFLAEWGIEEKVFTITCDNTKYNDVLVDCLKRHLRLNNMLVCDGDVTHVHCFAYVLNFIVQSGLKVIEEAIEKIRDSVKYVRGSASRKFKFAECIQQLSLQCGKHVRQDNVTRWNSTYLMLDCALAYREAYAQLTLVDSDFKTCLSEEEWTRVKIITRLLKPFYDINILFSKSSYPTSDLYFHKLWRIKLYIEEEIHNADRVISDMAKDMKIKFDKYWENYSMILSFAIILDPRYKIKLVEYCFSKLNMTYEVREKILKSILSGMDKLYNEYDIRSEQSHDSSMARSSNVSVDTLDELDGFDSFEGQFRSVEGEKSQLTMYLEEPRLDRKQELDVLQFWKENQERYPHLALMARDILSIPIITIASESSFSIGGQVINKYQTFSSSSVEALLCTRDWLFDLTDTDESETEEELVEDIEALIPTYSRDNF